jgi:hypothetical protein
LAILFPSSNLIPLIFIKVKEIPVENECVKKICTYRRLFANAAIIKVTFYTPEKNEDLFHQGFHLPISSNLYWFLCPRESVSLMWISNEKIKSMFWNVELCQLMMIEKCLSTRKFVNDETGVVLRSNSQCEPYCW